MDSLKNFCQFIQACSGLVLFIAGAYTLDGRGSAWVAFSLAAIGAVNVTLVVASSIAES
jgi:hypothetical protein